MARVAVEPAPLLALLPRLVIELLRQRALFADKSSVVNALGLGALSLAAAAGNLGQSAAAGAGALSVDPCNLVLAFFLFRESKGLF